MNIIDEFLNKYNGITHRRRFRNTNHKMFRKINSMFFDKKSRKFIKHLILSYELKTIKKVNKKYNDNDKLCCSLCKQKLSLTNRNNRAYTGVNTNTYLDHRCIDDLHEWRDQINDYTYNKSLDVLIDPLVSDFATKLKGALE
jgi:hypothetical protein